MRLRIKSIRLKIFLLKKIKFQISFPLPLRQGVFFAFYIANVLEEASLES